MKTQTIHVTNTLSEQSCGELSALLSRIPGVDVAICSPVTGTISVRFDEDRTSGLEIETAIARAGHRLAPTGVSAREAGCCGGCGGH